GTGQCVTNDVASGTPVAGQTPGDCKKNVCNGSGGIVTAVDNTDVFVDGNECTNDLCTNGVPSNPPRSSGFACSQGGGSFCNGSATTPACVQCLQPDDCGTDTVCKTFSCSGSGQCRSSTAANGTLVTTAPAGDCHKDVCMGGATTTVVDDSDVPADGNPCTNDICTGGVPSHSNVGAGVNCGGTNMCNGQG